MKNILIKQLNNLELICNNNKLSEDKTTFFLNNIQKLISSRKIKFIYRGESHLKEIYNFDCSNIELLCNYIFCLGEKGKIFLSSSYTEMSLSKLWKFMHNTVCKLNFNSENSRIKIQNFLNINSCLNTYFSNNENKEKFMDFENDEYEKVIIEYYYTLLHTMYINANRKSHFISTSINLDIANEFSSTEGIVIYGWISKKEFNKQHKSRNSLKSKITEIGLPTYEGSVFPEQKEITLKCGLLPHYILGFQYKNKFYVNPNFLNQTVSDEIIYNGLEIDQSDFNTLLNNTKYNRSYIKIDDVYYILNHNEVFTTNHAIPL